MKLWFYQSANKCLPYRRLDPSRSITTLTKNPPQIASSPCDSAWKALQNLLLSGVEISGPPCQIVDATCSESVFLVFFGNIWWISYRNVFVILQMKPYAESAPKPESICIYLKLFLWLLFWVKFFPCGPPQVRIKNGRSCKTNTDAEKSKSELTVCH